MCPESYLNSPHRVKHVHKNLFVCSCGCVFDYQNKIGATIMKHSKQFVKSTLEVKEVERVKAEELEIEDPSEEEAAQAIEEAKAGQFSP